MTLLEIASPGLRELIALFLVAFAVAHPAVVSLPTCCIQPTALLKGGITLHSSMSLRLVPHVVRASLNALLASPLDPPVALIREVRLYTQPFRS